MTSWLEGAARLAARRARWIAGVWIVCVLVASPLAAKQGSRLSSGGFTAPGSGSADVNANLPRFPTYDPHSLAVLLSTNQQTDTEPAMLSALGRAESVVDGVKGLSVTQSALSQAREEAALPTTHLTIHAPASQDAQDNAAVTLRDHLHPGTADKSGVTTYLVGQAALWAELDELSKQDLTKGEKVGFPIVLIILLAVFGGFAAASLPLLLGVCAVVLSGALIYLLSVAVPVSIFATNIASMLGIGVAVDYSLFMLVRYQRELRRGATREVALSAAMRTSGYAILASGLTVFVSLAGLLLIDSTVVRSMAAGAMSVVVIAVLGALTLTPVLMRRFGNRYRPEERILGRAWRALTRRPAPPHAGETPATAFWARWARGITAQPVPALLGSVGVLCALALPALSMKVNDAALDQFPSHSDARQANMLLTETFGPGVTGPVQVLVRTNAGATPQERAAAVRQVTAILTAHPELKPATEYVSSGRREVLLSAVPRYAPDGPIIHHVVEAVRGQLKGAHFTKASAVVGGTTAETEDYAHSISSSLWKVAVFIALATFGLLVLFLRSIVLPLKAVLMTALTVAATYGILVAVFQRKWVDFGGPGYLGTLTPPFVLALTFGLSMDYQVFLLTRIRERWLGGATNEEAVEQGLATSASAISSAALIMVAVFAGFAAVSVPSVREIGLGMAVAIAIDATLVRLILVPAAMRLLGDWNWFPAQREPGRAARSPQTVGEPAPVVLDDRS